MNMFKAIFLDAILLIFPILIYVIYLSANKNIFEKSKKIYFRLTLLTSYFMIYTYNINSIKLVPILVLSSIILLSYLEDLYIFANIFLLLVLFTYIYSFNNIPFLLLGYIFIAILYLLRKQKSISNIVFIELCIFINCITYFLWLYLYNKEFFSIEFMFNIGICYLFLANIMFFMYEIGKKILKTHMNYKELQQEKQIRLSLFKITHEIKNPIAVCKGYLDMLNVKDQKQVERYIPIIKSEIERLLSLLQDFLLINKSNLDFDIMDFNLLIEDTIDKLGPYIRDNNIDINLKLIDEEVFINGDYNRLSQVLINIIKNSIESIENNKKGSIMVSTKIDSNNYCITIEDNGIGMDNDTLSKIKEPFFTTKKRGSGLGVSLIYEIVEAHCGSVYYESKYGKGTRVTIKLPMYE